MRGGRHSERQLLGLHRIHNVLRGHQLRCTVRIRPAEFLSLALLHAEHHRRGGRGDLVLDDVLDIPHGDPHAAGRPDRIVIPARVMAFVAQRVHNVQRPHVVDGH